MEKNKNLCMKMKKMIDRRKRIKALSEVKPVENISKNLQSYLEITARPCIWVIEFFPIKVI